VWRGRERKSWYLEHRVQNSFELRAAETHHSAPQCLLQVQGLWSQGRGREREREEGRDGDREEGREGGKVGVSKRIGERERERGREREIERDREIERKIEGGKWEKI
jgi:hypothetical protein